MNVPVTAATTNSRHNLPNEVTSFVGRAYALTEVRRLLEETRLLTLVGPGGSGKTRLALRSAAEALGVFSDGVWLVDLTTVSDPALLDQAVARAIGIRETRSAPSHASLIARIDVQEMLLLLDNCEHLIEGCASLAETLLEGCGNLRILATSREPLRAAGETVWVVPPLALPTTSVLLASALVEEVDSVKLFLDRARSRRPGFSLGPEHIGSIIEICRRVDGIPLAIELAAAQCGALGVEQIAAHLNSMLGLLTGGRRSVPRQETLRATLDWSHALLSDSERALFRRLAVFAGSFNLAAAEDVALADPLETAQVLPNLVRLVEKSLLVAETMSTETRYRLLEPIRQYADEHLNDAGEQPALKERHAQYYAALAEAAHPHSMSGRRSQWLQMLDAESDNLRAAMVWGNGAAGIDSSGEAVSDVSLRIVAALVWHWFWLGRQSEGLRWAESALDASEGHAPALARGRALCAAGLLAFLQGSWILAAERACESVRLLRETADIPSLAFALMVWDLTEDSNEAQRGNRIAEAESLFRSIGDDWGLAQARRFAGKIALSRGDYTESAAMFRESLALFQSQGDDGEAAHALIDLGDATRSLGQYDAAAGFYEESLALLRSQGIKGMTPSVLHNLAYVALGQGKPRRAFSLFQDGLASFREDGDQRGIAECLTGSAAVLAVMARPEEAAQLLGAAGVILNRSGTVPWRGNEESQIQTLELIQSQIEGEAFERMHRLGGTLHLDEALAVAASAAGDAEAPSEIEKGLRLAQKLSPREREVAALVARGLTSRRIGERLFIAEGTAALHVKHILAKLQLTSRSQIAAWAVEQGLTSSSDGSVE